jgi:hypothetical protein
MNEERKKTYPFEGYPEVFLSHDVSSFFILFYPFLSFKERKDKKLKEKDEAYVG